MTKQLEMSVKEEFLAMVPMIADQELGRDITSIMPKSTSLIGALALAQVLASTRNLLIWPHMLLLSLYFNSR